MIFFLFITVSLIWIWITYSNCSPWFKLIKNNSFIRVVSILYEELALISWGEWILTQFELFYDWGFMRVIIMYEEWVKYAHWYVVWCFKLGENATRNTILNIHNGLDRNIFIVVSITA